MGEENNIETHYFIDESGQTDLFDGDGNVVIDTKDNSRFFYIGFLIVDKPNKLSRGLVKLRRELIKDPYFEGITSMQPEEKKTHYVFHAHDDCWEVKERVFRYLREFQGLHFLACVKDKFKVLEWVRSEEKRDSEFRYHGNMLYDHSLSWLIRDHLGKSMIYRVHIAKRGRKDREDEITKVLQRAQERYKEVHHKDTDSEFVVNMMTPKQHACLQAVDYFMWALQRMYEKRQPRFVNFLWRHFRLVIDIDDKRKNIKGEYYNNKYNPLTMDKLIGRLNDKPGI